MSSQEELEKLIRNIYINKIYDKDYPAGLSDEHIETLAEGIMSRVWLDEEKIQEVFDETEGSSDIELIEALTAHAKDIITWGEKS